MPCLDTSSSCASQIAGSSVSYWMRHQSRFCLAVAHNFKQVNMPAKLDKCNHILHHMCCFKRKATSQDIHSNNTTRCVLGQVWTSAASLWKAGMVWPLSKGCVEVEIQEVQYVPACTPAKVGRTPLEVKGI